MRGRRRKQVRDPADAALRLAELLPQPNAVIGALAVTAHGYVRATSDVDFVSPADPRKIRASLAAGGVTASIRRGDVLRGDIRSVVFGSIDGVRFDVLFPPVPIDWGETVSLTLEEGRPPLRVVGLDGLMRLKLWAGGPQDLIDVVHLVRLHPETLPKAVAVAEAYGIRHHLESWLADPRLRAPEGPPPLRPLQGRGAGNAARPTPRREGRPSAGRRR